MPATYKEIINWPVAKMLHEEFGKRLDGLGHPSPEQASGVDVLAQRLRMAFLAEFDQGYAHAVIHMARAQPPRYWVARKRAEYLLVLYQIAVDWLNEYATGIKTV